MERRIKEEMEEDVDEGQAQEDVQHIFLLSCDPGKSHYRDIWIVPASP